MESHIVKREVPQDHQLAAIMSQAIEKGTDPAGLEKLFDLYEHMQDKQAEKELSASLSEFRSKCPPIPKDATAHIVSKRTGGKYSYSFAPLKTIQRVIDSALAAEGVTYSWDEEGPTPQGMVIATCYIRKGTACITSKCSRPIDSEASMSGAQKVTAAITTAKRQSLANALGLRLDDPDVDGAEVEDHMPSQKVTQEQAANIDAALTSAGIDQKKFLQWAKVERISDIPASSYSKIMETIEERRKAAK